MRTNRLNLLVDCTLLGSVLVSFATGLVLFFGFHVADGPWGTEMFRIDRLTWLNLHRLTTLFVVAAMIAHLALHIEPLRNRIRRPRRWKSEAAMILTFLTVTFSGYAAWFLVSGSIRLTGPMILGPLPIDRHVWVDLHNFSGLAALPLIIVHTVHRWSWITRNLRSLIVRSAESTSPNRSR